MALVLGENMFASEMQFLPMHGWLAEDCFNTEASTESEEELTKSRPNCFCAWTISYYQTREEYPVNLFF